MTGFPRPKHFEPVSKATVKYNTREIYLGDISALTVNPQMGNHPVSYHESPESFSWDLLRLYSVAGTVLGCQITTVSKYSAKTRDSVPSVIWPHRDTLARSKYFILGSHAIWEAPFLFPESSKARLSCWSTERDQRVRGPEETWPVLSARTTRACRQVMFLTDRPNHFNSRAGFWAFKKPNLICLTKQTQPAFSSQLRKPVKSNGNLLHQVHINQTNTSEIPQEKLAEEWWNSVGLGVIFPLYRKYSINLLSQPRVHYPVEFPSLKISTSKIFVWSSVII